jgi:hypothetical protein
MPDWLAMKKAGARAHDELAPVFLIPVGDTKTVPRVPVFKANGLFHISVKEPVQSFDLQCALKCRARFSR